LKLADRLVISMFFVGAFTLGGSLFYVFPLMVVYISQALIRPIYPQLSLFLLKLYLFCHIMYTRYFVRSILPIQYSIGNYHAFEFMTLILTVLMLMYFDIQWMTSSTIMGAQLTYLAFNDYFIGMTDLEIDLALLMTICCSIIFGI